MTPFVVIGVLISKRKPVKKLVLDINDSFVGNAYDAFKDKVCFGVKFKGVTNGTNLFN